MRLYRIHQVILASCAHGAFASLRGASMDDSSRGRALQDACAGLKGGDCGKVPGCTWGGGNVGCLPSTPPPTSPATPPPTNLPTPPPSTGQPTPLPSNSPTTAPSTRPTNSPAPPGVGSCSDGSGTCSSVGDCTCGGGGGGQRDLRRQRLLQDGCAPLNGGDCNKSPDCIWGGGSIGCQPSGPPPTPPPIAPPTTSQPTNEPTNPPTLSPTHSPTTSPTQQPTQCLCVGASTPSPTLSISPTVSPTRQPTSQPSSSPTSSPSNAPSTQPTSQPSGSPTSSPSKSPTQTPTSQPSISPTSSPSKAPSTQPSRSPTTSPTLSPLSSKPTLPTTYYEYGTGTTKCDGSSNNYNIQGPAPLADKSNVAIEFFAFGDTPYDDSCNSCNTCIGTNGPEADCQSYTCTLSNSNMDQLPVNNTCTYEGDDYDCLKTEIIPYMNGKMNDGTGAFAVHVGDILKGKGSGGSRRCQDSSFTSRRNLFSALSNFLLVPGDNEWNECEGYDLNSNTDWVRRLWRKHFADAGTSPFNQFVQDFPAVTGSGRPTIARQTTNPENYYFEYNDVAFIGLNRVAGDQYVDDVAASDVNAEWVTQQLQSDLASCSLKSIVMVGHLRPSSDVNSALNAYFAACSVLPTLTISGNAHPSTYCMEKTNERVDLTVEAFRSGPILVSIVRNPATGDDYFHVDDADLINSNSQCPSFNM